MFADCSFTQCFRGRAAVEEEIFSLVELTSAQSQRVTVFPESINDGQYTLSDQKNRSLSAQCYIITELACCSQTFKPAFSFLAGSSSQDGVMSFSVLHLLPCATYRQGQ